MSLTPQEERCIRLACEALSVSQGGAWRIPDGPTLDDLNPHTPSPEVIVEADDGRRAAIEVKRLTGDSGYRIYKESLLSLNRALVPSCGGYYFIAPPDDFRLPIDKPLRRQVARQIELVAPTLRADDKGVLRMEKSGYLVYSPNPSLCDAHCLHNGGRAIMQPLNQSIEGDLFLIDDGNEHSFFTDVGKAQFLDVLRSAYASKKFGSTEVLTWYEEWQIIKIDQPGEDREDGVEIIAVTAARDVRASVQECLDTVIAGALSKFGGKRWANLHVVVLEVETILMTPERSLPVIGDYSAAELSDVDLMLLVHDDDVYQAYPAAGLTSQPLVAGQRKEPAR